MFRPALILIALGSASASATIFGVDDRISASSREFAPIGVVTGGEKVVYGSGFLVDACSVLTARHVGGSVEDLVGKRLTFQSGSLASEGRVVAAGPLQAGPSESRSIGKDWMIVRLSRCLGSQIGFLRLSTAAAVFAGRHEFKVEAAGFPRDRPIAAGVSIDPNCRVLWVGGGRIAHDCATIAGNSGGPLLARDSAGWVAIGINAAGSDVEKAVPFRASEANLAVDLGSIAPYICSVIGHETENALCG